MARPRKQYPPREGWRAYNERLVRRGELYLKLSFLRDWQREVAEINLDKRGRPYVYPPSLVEFCCVLYNVFHLPYRQLEGVLRAVSIFVPELEVLDYTTGFRRISQLDFKLPRVDAGEPLVVGSMLVLAGLLATRILVGLNLFADQTEVNLAAVFCVILLVAVTAFMVQWAESQDRIAGLESKLTLENESLDTQQQVVAILENQNMLLRQQIAEVKNEQNT